MVCCKKKKKEEERGRVELKMFFRRLVILEDTSIIYIFISQ